MRGSHSITPRTLANSNRTGTELFGADYADEMRFTLMQVLAKQELVMRPKKSARFGETALRFRTLGALIIENNDEHDLRTNERQEVVVKMVLDDMHTTYSPTDHLKGAAVPASAGSRSRRGQAGCMTPGIVAGNPIGPKHTHIASNLTPIVPRSGPEPQPRLTSFSFS